MSYSFSVTASTKALAVEQVCSKFDEVVVAQPNHVVDKDAAIAAAKSFVDLLREPSEFDQVSVSVSGYLSWNSPDEFVGANVAISASVHVAR